MDVLEGASQGLELNSDEEDALSSPSNFSSCGSEFERYCSANSVLGTASSVCSSVGNHNELLDNIRSLGLVDDLEFFGGRNKLRCRSFGRRRKPANLGRLDWFSDGILDSPRENGSYESPVISRTPGPSHRMAMDLDHFVGCNDSNGGGAVDILNGDRKTSMSSPERDLEVRNAYIEPGSSIVAISVCEDDASSLNSEMFVRGSTSESGAQSGPLLLDVGVDSSVSDSGSDDETRIHLLKGEALQKSKNTNANDHGNPLLMNTTVAFGDNDWDDFILENGDVGLPPAYLFGSGSSEHAEKHENLVVMDTIENDSLDGVEETQLFSTSQHRVYVKHEEDYSIKDPPADNWDGQVQRFTEDSPTGKRFDITTDNHDVSMDIHGEELQPLDNDKTSDFHDAMIHGDFPSQLADFTCGESHANKQAMDSKTSNSSAPLMLKNDIDEDIPSDEAGHSDTKELFDEMVLDMEEILLDSGESRQGRYAQAVYMSQHFHYRDGSSTASTSDTNETQAFYQPPFKIERVEVVGAKQKKGDVSFGERLVGVKEFTVYRLRVWSGKDHWEVERRYREFFSLYQQLKAVFSNHNLILPSPWSNVERESRKIFGNISPSIVSERSSLIQDCLCSILDAKTPFGVPTSLILFLTSSKDNNPGLLSINLPQSLQTVGVDIKVDSSHVPYSQEVTALGKKISLVVELKQPKSTRQLLEEQRYMCSGCHKHLDTGKSLMLEFVKTMGWHKPKLCEYTGQLFCSSCHSGDTAILPARVLHNWDFSLYPISQLAKAYLESIYDKPMLCVSAVNPFLFSRVPALHHIMSIRRKAGAMVPYIRCPFKRSIQRGLGSRRYLLEGNDFFALRDLVDLSKGPFAALPTIVEAASSKILEHITQQCLICYDIGTPCAAKQACKDPASTILPFQESDAIRCSLCSGIFHEPCFRYLHGCPCRKMQNISINKNSVPSESSFEVPIESRSPTLQRTDLGASTAGFFSDLLSRAAPEKLWKRKSSRPVILMGSLPSSSM